MRVTDASSFGLAVKNRRKERQLTQKELSELTGLSSSFISDLENGKETVELGKSFLLASVLGLNITIDPRG